MSKSLSVLLMIEKQILPSCILFLTLAYQLSSCNSLPPDKGHSGLNSKQENTTHANDGVHTALQTSSNKNGREGDIKSKNRLAMGEDASGKSKESQLARTLLSQTEQFSAQLKKIGTLISSDIPNEQQLQQLFLESRLAYKKIEWATEHFLPVTSRFVNGPPVQEAEVDGMGNNVVMEPAGLQVLETLLFPKFDRKNVKEILRQLDIIQSNCNTFKIRFLQVPILDWQIIDACKLEVFRIISLGITGFDNPLTLRSMQESATSLRSIRTVLASYTDKNDRLLSNIDAAIANLNQHTDFNSFQRDLFITEYCNPITRAISDIEVKQKMHPLVYLRLLNQAARTLFDTNAVNMNAFVPNIAAMTSPKKIALGKMLFADPILSEKGSRSCQSCHQPEKAFTDGLVKNTVLNSLKLLPRNTPTLLNAALQPALFYDLRAGNLESQSLAVISNKDEMHGSIVSAADKLWQNKRYRHLFTEAFPSKNRRGIDTLEIMNVIGSYIRSLTQLNSRFDFYMRGNKTALSTQEIKGFNLFMGKAKCATCHYMPLFNGAFPPRYVKIDAEVIGVPASKKAKKIDPDLGRFAIVKIPSLKHAFKTPTLRNIALTAPYMHNGVYNTLTEVMDFYNKGGGKGLGYKVENQTLPFDKLNLSTQESKAIVAFMKSLNSQHP